MAFLTAGLIRHPCPRSAPLRRLFATKSRVRIRTRFFILEARFAGASGNARPIVLALSCGSRRERCGIAARTANHQFLRGLRCVLLSSANRVLGVLAVKLRLNALSGVSGRNTVALCARNARPRVAPHWCMGAAVRQPGRIQRGGVSLRSKPLHVRTGSAGYLLKRGSLLLRSQSQNSLFFEERIVRAWRQALHNPMRARRSRSGSTKRSLSWACRKDWGAARCGGSRRP